MKMSVQYIKKKKYQPHRHLKLTSPSMSPPPQCAVECIWKGFAIIPREVSSREVYNLVAREARVYYTSIERPAWFPLGYKCIVFWRCLNKLMHA